MQERCQKRCCCCARAVAVMVVGEMTAVGDELGRVLSSSSCYCCVGRGEEGKGPLDGALPSSFASERLASSLPRAREILDRLINRCSNFTLDHMIGYIPRVYIESTRD